MDEQERRVVQAQRMLELEQEQAEMAAAAQGRPAPDELAPRVVRDNGRVVVAFAQPTLALRLSPAQARTLAAHIQRSAAMIEREGRGEKPAGRSRGKGRRRGRRG